MVLLVPSTLKKKKLVAASFSLSVALEVGSNLGVPQRPVFERRSSRVTELCIAEQSWNVSLTSN